jgi:hypothetical protein
MNYMKTTAFSVSNLTDIDLSNLFHSCADELQKRADQRSRRRTEWIKSYCWSFMAHPHAAVHTSEKRAIVAIYDRYDGVKIGTAYHINGDVYDYETGVAVAYAKALGKHIPDYI